MNAISRKFPIGIQSFEDIRTGDYLYVDKTALVWTIANSGKPYFLSRPRRFGKSLLISTFEAYFQGRKDLFEGLAITELEKEWKTYPVLHLDLNAEKYDSPERLHTIISRHLVLWEDAWGKEEREITLSDRFSGVIRRAYEQTGFKVVVLIDEYDKPLLQAILNEDLLKEFRNTLKGFYGVLKSSDSYLRFVFLTGVTKFAQVSIFSDLNQLNDISMWSDYATICGITHEELTATFMPELEAMAVNDKMSVQDTIDRMTVQYDGYHFSADTTTGIFNPFSVLNALQKKKFENYWFHTGTPTFLVDLLKETDYDLRRLIDGVEAEPEAFAEYRADISNPIPLIYQSGYLTIKDYDSRFGLYLLQFPNDEVKYAFLKFLGI